MRKQDLVAPKKKNASGNAEKVDLGSGTADWSSAGERAMESPVPNPAAETQ